MKRLIFSFRFSQDRAKIRQNRRPPSRKARVGAASHQADDIGTTAAVAAADSLASQPFSSNVTPRPPQKPKPSGNAASNVPRRQPVNTSNKQEQLFANNDITGDNDRDNSDVKTTASGGTSASTEHSAEQAVTSDKVTSWLETTEQPKARAASKSIFEEGDSEGSDDDLFSISKPSTTANSSAKVPHATPVGASKNISDNTEGTGVSAGVRGSDASKVASGFQEPPPLKLSSVDDVIEPPAAQNLFSNTLSDDDELFGSGKLVSQNTQQVAGAAAGAFNDDSLFSSAASTKAKSQPYEAIPDDDDDDDDDDLFTISSSTLSRTTKSNSKLPATGPAIFAEDDIFADTSGVQANRSTAKLYDADIFGERAQQQPKLSAAKADVKPDLFAQPNVHDDEDIFSDTFTSTSAMSQPEATTSSAPPITASASSASPNAGSTKKEPPIAATTKREPPADNASAEDIFANTESKEEPVKAVPASPDHEVCCSLGARIMTYSVFLRACEQNSATGIASINPPKFVR